MYQVKTTELITLREAQRILKMDRSTLEGLVKSGQIPAQKKGSEWKILRKNLIRWMNTGNHSYVVLSALQNPAATRTVAMIKDWT